MSLKVISGPPGSGREGLILDRFEAAIDRDPLLVVPTGDDVDRLERELCGRGGGSALLGGSVSSFPRLFEAVAEATGISAPPVLSRMQRVWLARAATAQTPLRQLRRSAEREGFAPALEELLADLGAAGLDAAAFTAAVEEVPDSAYEIEIAALLRAFEELRDQLGMTDEHAVGGRATAALRANPGAWRERPVLLYGFDDLSRRQLELVGALAQACEVTVAITFESGRPALDARAQLRAELIDGLGAEIEAPLSAGSAGEEPSTLRHLERNLFEPEPARIEPVDGSLHLLEGAGERSEAELIGRRIALLLAEGVDPDQIAVAVRSPDRQAPLIARVLAGLGIPVAAEARVPLATTSTGSAILRLLAMISGEGGAKEVVAFLRGPARARSSSVDWLERRVLRDRMRSAEDALESWRGGERERRIWEREALLEVDADPAAFAATLTRIAADVAERPHLRSGIVPSSGPAVELRAAAEIGRALAEAAELGPHAPAPGEIAELLSHVRVPLWRGPTEGRIRILSPYRLRATRLAHLFVAGLSDGSFPARGGADPLLAESRRGALGLAARRDPAAEERYLFYSCVSRPEEHLHLAYPVSDESGAPITRSPFVEEVRTLLAPPPPASALDDDLERAITTRAGPEEVVPAPGEASTRRDLTRALAALGGDSPKLAAGLALPGELRAAVLADLEDAVLARRAAIGPGPLTNPAVLEELAIPRPFGASTLEEFDNCPYRWFVHHELSPRPIGPDPEPLEDGGVVHAVLERLYRNPPTGRGRPEPETVGDWEHAAGELILGVAEEREWDLAGAQARIRIARFEAVIARFLRRDADTGGPMTPDPDLLEASFGERPDDRFPPAELAGFELHGRIDRIDVAAGGEALIRDYKLSKSVTPGAKLVSDGKLQMPLYLLAAKGFGIEPIGGLYSPLGATSDDRPRGLVDKEYKGTLVPAGTSLQVSTDFVDAEAFEKVLAEAEQRAGEHVTDIRAGNIGRRPRNGECPRWCDLAPVCRIERGAAVQDPEEEEDEAA